ncbi:MAG: two pore domain potassium channel family protein [Shimia sp.]|nr:two pore domain potassium channel family protein [Shimia sp.]MCP4825345.1 two pore domain potassium channel family protein [Shimia sp.]|mmetsp:Transcript_28392/g.53064  ORF Transcript_28392/g.53064 Transcript_28392/m.53064 type:complete len:151 (+) Transcript_28392:1340-1792(+)
MSPDYLAMSQHDQLLWGSVVLSACALIHVGLLACMIEALSYMGRWVRNRSRMLRTTAVVGAAFVMIVSSHTIQVWLWAAVLLYMDAFEYLYDALYFSLVTYTTVGYGDVVLPVEFRVFGAFGGVTGILCFGISTAFLVSLINKLLPKSLE